MDEQPAKPKRRRWFQFHLSTLIVLHLAAAGMVWLNIYEPPPRGFRYDPRPVKSGSGWPFKDQLEFDFTNKEMEDEVFIAYLMDGPGRDFRIVCLNVLVGLLILTAIGVICERSLRYLESRREGSSAH
jgi:hypothetical protein